MAAKKTKKDPKVKTPQKSKGRPSDYTEEMADKVCSLLAEGKSMRTVCAPKNMPDKSTVFRWIRTVEAFRNQYEKAKEESADAMLEETLDIADNGSNDWMETHEKENVGYKINGEAIQRSRLRADIRKWAMSKLKPKKYGDRITTEHTGNIGLTDLTNEELTRKIHQLEQANVQSTKT